MIRKDETLRLRDGRELAYAEYGDPDGFPVMLFHGNPSSHVGEVLDALVAMRGDGAE